MLRTLFVGRLITVLAASASAAEYKLLATPSTVAWGYYSSFSKPVLTVKSGDTVKMQTLASCGDEKALAREGVAAADIPNYIAPIHEQVADKGPGGHIITGPLAVLDAEVGDVLYVQVAKI